MEDAYEVFGFGAAALEDTISLAWNILSLKYLLDIPMEIMNMSSSYLNLEFRREIGNRHINSKVVSQK